VLQPTTLPHALNNNNNNNNKLSSDYEVLPGTREYYIIDFIKRPITIIVIK
jgi:hypothetical protein